MEKEAVVNKPYFLAVRGILFDEQRRILLLKRSSCSRHQPGYWEFPGGKVGLEENVSEALKREFVEETGLEISLEKVLGAGAWEREEYRIAYLFMLVKRLSGEIRLSREHDAYAWMTKAVLATAEISPQLAEFRDKML